MRFSTRKVNIVKMQLKQIFQNIKIDSVLPILLIIVINLIAFNSFECCTLVFLGLLFAMPFIYYYCAKKSSRFVVIKFFCEVDQKFLNFLSRTNFFFVFGVSSGIYLLVLFEFFVPLLELLPQENIVFITLTFVSVYFFYRVSHLMTCSWHVYSW